MLGHDTWNALSSGATRVSETLSGAERRKTPATVDILLDTKLSTASLSSALRWACSKISAPTLGNFRHGRELAPIVNRGIVRPNRDTLYSFAVFDFDAGPVTVTLADAGKRFVVMQVVNEDQYIPAVFHGAGRHTLTKEGIATRYGVVVVRMMVDPANPQDVQQVHALQDALTVSQQSPGSFEIPNWDEASLKKLHAALLQLGETIFDTRRMFGAKEEQIDPVRYLVGTALVWGGFPEKDAL